VLLGGLAVLGQVPNLHKKPLYNPGNGFCTGVPFADSARILIARKNFPADNLKDFTAYAQANQGKMQFGSSGAGSGLHICVALLNIAMGAITHVPNRGSAWLRKTCWRGASTSCASRFSPLSLRSSPAP
jgi:tripartite-type tricarboxylate transporter receptor subunit TctC